MSRYFNPFPQSDINSGKVNGGGTLTFAINNTDTAKNVFSDQALSVSLGNVVTLDAAGKSPTNIFLSPALYRITEKDSAGVQLSQTDDFSGVAQVGDSIGSTTVDGSFIVNAASGLIILSGGAVQTLGGNWSVSGTLTGSSLVLSSSISTSGPAGVGITAATVTAMTGTPNTADAALLVVQDSVTGRSINASGTINASGADYAEYMKLKRPEKIAKGDIVGIDSEGLVTTRFSEAINFGVKSTNPGMVGGDSWFERVKPEMPKEEIPAYNGAIDTNHPDFESDKKSYLDLVNSIKAKIEALMPAYIAELESWNSEMLAARSLVDRIAFCGIVPINIEGSPGDFIIPKEGENDTITGVSVSSPAHEDYINSVGRVHKPGYVMIR